MRATSKEVIRLQPVTMPAQHNVRCQKQTAAEQQIFCNVGNQDFCDSADLLLGCCLFLTRTAFCKHSQHRGPLLRKASANSAVTHSFVRSHQQHVEDWCQADKVTFIATLLIKNGGERSGCQDQHQHEMVALHPSPPENRAYENWGTLRSAKGE